MSRGSRNGRLYAAAENGAATAVQQGIYRVKSPESTKKAALTDGLILAEKVGFLFCGKATAVAMCHRHIAKSRLSNPTFK